MRMKKTRQLLRALMLGVVAMPLSAAADSTIDTEFLILTENGEKTAEFRLNDTPVLSFNGDSLVVVSSGDSLVVPVSGLSYHFETRQVVTGIDDVPSVIGNGSEAFAFSHGTVFGLKPGVKVSVYSTNGTKVSEVSAGTDGSADLRLGTLPKGIYIVKTPAKSLKLINR